MFNLRVTKNEPSDLDQAIKRLYTLMSEADPTTQPYDALTDQLAKLHKLKENENSRKRVSADTLAVVGGNLAGIAVLMGYERTHVIATKAFNLLLKPR